MPTSSRRPKLITPMRSARSKASSWSWVTRMVAIPSLRWIDFRLRRSSTRILASRAPSGSSSSSTSGWYARARARATRCCCPPESWRGMRDAQACQPDQVQQLIPPPAALGCRHLADAQAELDIFGHAHVLEQGVVLEDEAHPALLGGQVGDIAPVQQHPPVVRGGQPGDQAQDGGLPAAAGAEQDEELPIARPPGRRC